MKRRLWWLLHAPAGVTGDIVSPAVSVEAAAASSLLNLNEVGSCDKMATGRGSIRCVSHALCNTVNDPVGPVGVITPCLHTQRQQYQASDLLLLVRLGAGKRKGTRPHRQVTEVSPVTPRQVCARLVTDAMMVWGYIHLQINLRASSEDERLEREEEQGRVVNLGL